MRIEEFCAVGMYESQTLVEVAIYTEADRIVALAESDHINATQLNRALNEEYPDYGFVLSGGARGHSFVARGYPKV